MKQYRAQAARQGVEATGIPRMQIVKAMLINSAVPMLGSHAWFRPRLMMPARKLNYLTGDQFIVGHGTVLPVAMG